MKLIASDLDGTMLRPDCTISDYTKNVIRKLYEKEAAVFVPTTGRCFRSADAQIGDVEEIRYFNTSNGCVVYDKKEDVILHNHTLPADLAYEIYRDVKALGGSVEVYSDLDSYMEEQMFPLALVAFGKALSENLYATTVAVDSIEDAIRSGERKVNKYNAVFHTVEDKQKIYDKYIGREDIVVTIPTVHNLEIFYAGCDKDTALRLIEEKEGIAHEDCYAIGDSINDMAMIKYAQVGVAVANAMEPLKEVADLIVASCAEDGPAQFIEKLLDD